MKQLYDDPYYPNLGVTMRKVPPDKSRGPKMTLLIVVILLIILTLFSVWIF